MWGNAARIYSYDITLLSPVLATVSYICTVSGPLVCCRLLAAAPHRYTAATAVDPPPPPPASINSRFSTLHPTQQSECLPHHTTAEIMSHEAQGAREHPVTGTAPVYEPQLVAARPLLTTDNRHGQSIYTYI